MAKPPAPPPPASAQPAPEKPADSKKAEQAKENLRRLNVIVAAARELTTVWESTAFYDRQNPDLALALHDALSAYEHKK